MHFADLIKLASAVVKLLPHFKGEDKMIEVANGVKQIVDKFHATPGGQALQPVKHDLDKAIEAHAESDAP